MALNLWTNLPMFVYTFHAMWRHRPLEEYLVLLEFALLILPLVHLLWLSLGSVGDSSPHNFLYNISNALAAIILVNVFNLPASKFIMQDFCTCLTNIFNQFPLSPSFLSLINSRSERGIWAIELHTIFYLYFK